MLEADDLGEKILIKTLHKEAQNRLIPGKPDPICRIRNFDFLLLLLSSTSMV
jgi:hypothetical protein